MICHDRVDDAKRLGEHSVDVADAVYLFRCTQKARVHGICLHTDFLPSGEVVGEDIGRIVHIPAGKRRVAREDARGDRADVTSGGR